MAKGSRGRRRLSARQYRAMPYPLLSRSQEISQNVPKRCSKALEKKDWEDATCCVCMEYPHNAVLLLCSSHDKGCRPYMCGTSFRHSNCLDQYRKAYTKVVSSGGSVDNPIVIAESGWPVENEKSEASELACPLCRGQVKGWTVVEPAREYLNDKKRSCMHDDCSFVGTYRELKKHVKSDHPSARPREVDPEVEQKWRRLERERDRDDVMSTIRSTMPGAMVFGDYVIEGTQFDSDSEDMAIDADFRGRIGGSEVGFDRNIMSVVFLLSAFGHPRYADISRRLRQPQRADLFSSDESGGLDSPLPVLGLESSDRDDDVNNNDDDANDDDGGGVSLSSRLRRHGRVLLGRSGRRRRRREEHDGRT